MPAASDISAVPAELDALAASLDVCFDRLSALGEAWIEAKANGQSTTSLDDRIEEEVRVSRRLERQIKRRQKRLDKAREDSRK